MATHFKELFVWQRAMDLLEQIYILTRSLPKEETYALSDQMRRAAVSVPSNIAEGQQRYSTKDFIRFLLMAKGSCAELETQLYICIRLKYLTPEDTKKTLQLINEVGRMLSGLITKLSKSL